MFNSRLSLGEEYTAFASDGNQPSEIPWIIKLFENPSSPLALPGATTLFQHDCIHILLNRGKSSYDEAFVIGTTMGNDPKTNLLHILVFKFASRFLYPNPYKFFQDHFLMFDLGFLYGRRMLKRVPIEKLELMKDQKLKDLILEAGIDHNDLNFFMLIEKFLLHR